MKNSELGPQFTSYITCRGVSWHSSGTLNDRSIIAYCGGQKMMAFVSHEIGEVAMLRYFSSLVFRRFGLDRLS